MATGQIFLCLTIRPCFAVIISSWSSIICPNYNSDNE